jgi:hypothetical protein
MPQRKSGTAKRPTRSLNQRLEKKLIAYALAASAAGVSVLACLPRAEAEVVYTNTWVPLSPHSLVNIDLNQDGIVDFVISNVPQVPKTCSVYCASSNMMVLPGASGNAVWGAKSYASALSSRVSVGSNGQFQAGHSLMGNEFRGTNNFSFTTGYRSRGPWGQTTNRYLGVKFLIQGEVHYGWVRVDTAATWEGWFGAISGFAYESVANTPILTGQKSGTAKRKNHPKPGSAPVNAPVPTQGSLGALAIGALGKQPKSIDAEKL